ncbi:MAG TPA: tRNA (adenosine(37)-N6)-threonylcarbamoyltransferase complex ATPase subunit type 1 TsaE [Candidatus Paceibacterota bacterium]|nr:tRNA (adenosine(37)-N6)-threonylcarbamoyltransferase complex ATPase subunit type 1 TsaE [Candidatus Paceibacterota bacterium]
MTFVPLSDLPEYVRNVRAMIKMLPKTGSAITVWLIGDLGAGKTTFVQNMAREMEVTEDVQSPTYVLMKSYSLPNNRIQNGSKRRFNRLVHIDAYRLNNVKEFATLKPEEFLKDPGTLVLIEWPERVAEALPSPDLTVTFTNENAGEKERYIEVV